MNKFGCNDDRVQCRGQSTAALSLSFSVGLICTLAFSSVYPGTHHLLPWIPFIYPTGKKTAVVFHLSSRGEGKYVSVANRSIERSRVANSMHIMRVYIRRILYVYTLYFVWKRKRTLLFTAESFPNRCSATIESRKHVGNCERLVLQLLSTTD